VAELAARAAAGTPKSELARHYALSRETVYQYLRRHAATAADV
jgi:Mor family transcriptional regulator